MGKTNFANCEWFTNFYLANISVLEIQEGISEIFRILKSIRWWD